MPVLFSSAGSVDSNEVSGSVLTTPAFTVSGANPNIVVFIGARASSARTIASIVRGTDTFSLSGYKHNPTSSGQMHAWVYNSSNAPQAASATLAVTVSGGNLVSWFVLYIVTTGVNPSNRIEGVTLNAIDAGPVNSFITVPGTPGGLVVDGLAVRGSSSATVNQPTQVQRVTDASSTNAVGHMSTRAGGAFITMGWDAINPDGATIPGFVHYGWSHPPAEPPGRMNDNIAAIRNRQMHTNLRRGMTTGRRK